MRQNDHEEKYEKPALSGPIRSPEDAVRLVRGGEILHLYAVATDDGRVTHVEVSRHPLVRGLREMAVIA